MMDLYYYKAKVTRVVDGDTIDCDVFLGFHMTARIRFRLARINTPEVRGVEKVEGRAAKDYLIQLLEDNQNEVIIRTEKTGKYGRWLAEVYVSEINVNDDLVKSGHAEYVNY
jgi:micrococcal nuclease